MEIVSIIVLSIFGFSFVDLKPHRMCFTSEDTIFSSHSDQQ